MKRVLRYLRGTTNLELQLFRSTTSQLIAYSDADWAGCPATRRSTFGYCIFLGDNLLTWSSKCQDTLSYSSVEAEYHGVANGVAETSWIRNLLRELHTPLFIASLVYCDNVSAVYMSANSVQHQRTKHIEIDIQFVREKVAAGHVRVLHVPSRFYEGLDEQSNTLSDASTSTPYCSSWSLGNSSGVEAILNPVQIGLSRKRRPNMRFQEPGLGKNSSYQCIIFLKIGGYFDISIKANCIDCTSSARTGLPLLG
ncbi:ribonuclease H-like domain-containing protein [Tanacetum coccineum]|uniref:Ribonuclease H-like domain-containing protein n=1 Tax=Tanacetum coccineum TaxID=301880 RepID=A0ABQ5BVZ2_9ASTR